jgi:hypothetical protein
LNEVNVAKVIIYLRDHELKALNHLAQHEYRSPKAQAALIIRNELEKLGMIPGEQPVQSNYTEPLTKIQEQSVMEGG